MLDEQENAPHDGDTEVVIVNELLAYCAFHADRSTTDAIRDVLVRFIHQMKSTVQKMSFTTSVSMCWG